VPALRQRRLSIPQGDIDQLHHGVNGAVVERVRCPRYRVDVPHPGPGRQLSGVEQECRTRSELIILTHYGLSAGVQHTCCFAGKCIDQLMTRRNIFRAKLDAADMPG